MSEIPEVFTNMLAAWNDRDFDKIRGFIDKSLAENVVFADPTNFQFNNRRAVARL